MDKWVADSIAFKLSTSWPRSSITPDAWADELLDLDKGPAEEAVRRLVRTAEHPPTIAAFMAQYRALLGTARDDGPTCPDCDGTGLRTDTRHPQHWPGDPSSLPRVRNEDGTYAEDCICNVVTACSCRVGQSQGRRTMALVRGERQEAAA